VSGTDSTLVERQTTEDKGAQGCRIISCGIHPEQAQRYFDGLREIATEAERREENVVWG